MKNYIIGLIITCIFSIGISTNIYGQTVDVGIAGVYASNFNKVGFKISAGFTSSNDWIWRGNFTSLVHSDNNFFSNTTSMINANVGFDFVKNDDWSLYPFAGVNFSFLPNTSNSIKTKVGLNIGLGFEYTLLSWLGWNSSAKYTLLNPSFIEISTGLMIHF